MIRLHGAGSGGQVFFEQGDRLVVSGCRHLTANRGHQGIRAGEWARFGCPVDGTGYALWTEG